MDFIDLPSTFLYIKTHLDNHLILLVIFTCLLTLIILTLTKVKSKQKKFENLSELDENNSFDDIEHIPLIHQTIPHLEMKEKAKKFYEKAKLRRSCRFFSKQPVPKEVIKDIIRTAGTSPSGANLQPWTYIVISNNNVKMEIRQIVEEEEEINYKRRMGQQWVDDLKIFHLNWIKQYLTDAPYIILLFRQDYGYREDSTKQVNYYKELSTAISAGFLLMAIQNAGLVTVTTTPLNCGPRIKTLLGRPKNEKLILLFPVGYPSEDALVPNIQKKPLDQIMVEIE